jgi:hypothetical protein
MANTTNTQPRINRRRDARKLFVWLNQVRGDPELSPVAFMVAFEIGQHFNSRHGGAAWPSSLTIASNIRMSERSVIRAAKLLAQRGHLKIDPGKAGRGHSNQYFIVLQKGAAAHLKPAPKPAPAQVFRSSRKPASVALKPAPAQENYLEPSMGTLPAFPIGERERSLAFACPAGAPAPIVGAPEEGKEAVDRFSELLAIWKRPHGDEDEAAAWTAFVVICREDPEIADEIIASARRWVTAKAQEPEFLKPLEKWLARGAWKNLPPSPKPKRNGGKVALSPIGLEISRQFRRAGH